MPQSIVVRIGCLECGNPSDVLGVYPDATAALDAHPFAQRREDLEDHQFYGEAMDILFTLPD